MSTTDDILEGLREPQWSIKPVGTSEHLDALTVIEQQRAEIARLTNEVKAHVAVIHRLHAYAVTDHEIVWKDIEVMLDEERIEGGAG